MKTRKKDLLIEQKYFKGEKVKTKMCKKEEKKCIRLFKTLGF